MSPTIVMRDGEPILVIGSPGDSQIIGYVVQGIINYIDWDMDTQSALAAPHFVMRFGTFDMEGGDCGDRARGRAAGGWLRNKCH